MTKKTIYILLSVIFFSVSGVILSWIVKQEMSRESAQLTADDGKELNKDIGQRGQTEANDYNNAIVEIETAADAEKTIEDIDAAMASMEQATSI